jgi:hypothetical protein
MSSHWSESDNERKDRAKVAGQKIACQFYGLAFSLKHAHGRVPTMTDPRKEGCQMTNELFNRVGVASLSWTLPFDGSTTLAAPSAYAAQPIMPRKHRAEAATAASVNRGTI